uniref:Cleavage and polyadenylation specificity factor subunit 4 n=1 Tax=Lygus hesperus TaxID=30085 RepID=A0A0A9YE01_LYGHE
MAECAAYKRGFCPLGPQCKLRHVHTSSACRYFMSGFCPLGPQCPFGHPVQMLHDRASVSARVLSYMILTRAHDPTFHRRATCFRPSCLDPGHLASNCPGPQFSEMRRRLTAIQEPNEMPFAQSDDEMLGVRRCFMCGDETHTLQTCPRRAFVMQTGNSRVYETYKRPREAMTAVPRETNYNSNTNHNSNNNNNLSSIDNHVKDSRSMAA